ncbi:hypothetical protein L2E82_47226 [Cichorium intybus]|uniref:Uncharacterized protein n=1 Tax=Cichorium intybus TaxID=13427 RepID=A0ACB8YVF0_CICIN|nr:hypothetical protein L2E82_47226 [Cichorium intybus]
MADGGGRHATERLSQKQIGHASGVCGWVKIAPLPKMFIPDSKFKTRPRVLLETQVIDALNAEGPDIDIILSEIDLPIPKGMKMLKYIMREKDLRRILVIRLSGDGFYRFTVAGDGILHIHGSRPF